MVRGRRGNTNKSTFDSKFKKLVNEVEQVHSKVKNDLKRYGKRKSTHNIKGIFL